MAATQLAGRCDLDSDWACLCVTEFCRRRRLAQAATRFSGAVVVLGIADAGDCRCRPMAAVFEQTAGKASDCSAVSEPGIYSSVCLSLCSPNLGDGACTLVPVAEWATS